jgi:alkylation response protein AidB-like acyl-CoA dehydrogenase
MRANLLTDEHLMFRDAFRRFAEKEIAPHHAQWEKEGIVPRDLWQKAGASGFLCMDVDEAYGGLGVKDYRYNAIISEELVRVAASGPGFSVHTDMVAPYISLFGTEEQKRRWLPGPGERRDDCGYCHVGAKYGK